MTTGEFWNQWILIVELQRLTQVGISLARDKVGACENLHNMNGYVPNFETLRPLNFSTGTLFGPKFGYPPYDHHLVKGLNSNPAA